MQLFVWAVIVPVTAPLFMPPGGSLSASACDPTQIKSVGGLLAEGGNKADGAILAISQPRATTYRYDDLNRLVEVIHADGTRITYTYDAAGNLMQTVTRQR
jgi:YD repeat-containing protein